MYPLPYLFTTTSNEESTIRLQYLIGRNILKTIVITRGRWAFFFGYKVIRGAQ